MHLKEKRADTASKKNNPHQRLVRINLRNNTGCQDTLNLAEPSANQGKSPMTSSCLVPASSFPSQQQHSPTKSESSTLLSNLHRSKTVYAILSLLFQITILSLITILTSLTTSFSYFTRRQKCRPCRVVKCRSWRTASFHSR